MISLTDDEIEHRHPGYIEGLFAASDSDGISYDSNINSTHEFHNQLISVQTKVTENENSFFSSVFHKICDGWNYLVKAFSSLLNFFRNKKDVIVKH
jgi:hypothetical protein